MGESLINEEALLYIDALFGYAMTLTRERATAEDLVQETYVRAARAADKLADHSNVKSWLFVVMRNAWLNQVRHENKGPRFVGLEDEEFEVSACVAEQSTNPQIIYFRKLERDEVRFAIESLPVTYREVVVLRDIEGFSYQEIATVLGCPAGTVMSRLARAREKLRAILDSKKPKAKAKAG
jgi:RNA polymerase sigma-70 factor, ECF subfamily